MSFFFPHTAVNKSTDYQNYFQGLWDCNGDQPDELSFKRGDAIYILSKVWEQLESSGGFKHYTPDSEQHIILHELVL